MCWPNDRGRDLDEILAEVQEDLERREADLREQRRRVITLRARLSANPGLIQESLNDPGLVDYLSAVRAAGAQGPAVDRDQELLSLVGGDDATDLGAMLASIGSNGPGAARIAAIYERLDRLAGEPQPDPAIVTGLAADILDVLPEPLVTRARSGLGSVTPAQLSLIGEGLAQGQRLVVDAVIARLRDTGNAT